MIRILTSSSRAPLAAVRLMPMTVGALLTAAALAGGGAAATSDAQIMVSGGSLSVTSPNFQGATAMLDGTAQTISTSPATPWAAVDARGTGAAWSVTASATDLVSTGTPNRVIPSSALAITTGAVTAGTGADPVTGMTGSTAAPFTVPTGAGQTNVTVMDAPAPHRGSYTFTPTLDITVPPTAQPSYAGSPYTATLTVTIS